MVGAIRRRRAAPFRGSSARQDDRPTLPRGRVSRASRFPVKARLARGRTRTRPAGGSPRRASRLGRPADTRARSRGGRGLDDLDGEFDEAERWLHRAWEVAEPQIDPAAAVLLHMVTGMLHAGRGQHQSALEEFAAGAQAQSLLTGLHALTTPVVGWLAATQARLGMPDEARATLSGFSTESRDARHLQRACSDLAWRRETPLRRWRYSEIFGICHPRSTSPRIRSSKRICSPASRTCNWRIETPPPPQPRQPSRPPSQIG